MKQQQQGVEELAIMSLTEDEQATLNAYLDRGQSATGNDSAPDAIYFLKTINFEDGTAADFKIVGKERPSIEIDLFDPFGYLIGSHQPGTNQLSHNDCVRLAAGQRTYLILLHIPKYAGFAHLSADERLLMAIGAPGMARA